MAATAVRARTRVTSIDLLRGATIAVMVLINQPAVGPPYLYQQLTHAAWNGLTFADVVFPVFLVLVGVSMAQGSPPSPARIGRRVAILFGLGLLLNAAPLVLAGHGLGSMRVMGVLQRIALAYGVAALAVDRLRPRQQLLLAAGLLLGMWALLAWVPVPGHAAGVMTPTVNLPGWIDRSVFGSAHLYAPGYDPEGLLGTLSSAAVVLVGVWAGRVLRSERTRSAAALLAGVGGCGILLGRVWSHVLPINKRMWTPSFAVLTAGVALVALAVTHLVAGRSDRGLPLRMLGANALVVYVGSELTGAVAGALTHRVPGIPHAPFTYWVWWRWLQPGLGGKAGNLLWAAAVLAVWWAVAAAMWRRGRFVRA
jgi:predicted acyltransferase